MIIIPLVNDHELLSHDRKEDSSKAQGKSEFSLQKEHHWAFITLTKGMGQYHQA